MKRLALAISISLLGAMVLAGSAHAAFGFAELDDTFSNEDGSSAIQAGAHPFAQTTKIVLNTVPSGLLEPETLPDGAAKDIVASLPPGFVGAPNAVPQCGTADFLEEHCAKASQVGVAHVLITSLFEEPVFSLTPPPGVPMRIGFKIVGVPVTIDLTISPNPPYNVIATSASISNAVPFYSIDLDVWGVPGSSAHDAERFGCGSSSSCNLGIGEKVFLTTPRACTGPLPTTFVGDSWENQGAFTTGGSPDLSDPAWVKGEVFTHDEGEPPNPLGMTGCGKLGFSPSTGAQPTSKAANSPTGLDFSLDVQNEGLTNPSGISNADIRKTEVTLPEGFTINPSIAEGLNVCTEADLARETPFSPPGGGCPAASKIGTVEVETPLLEEGLDGALYQAAPYENPFGALVALYVVIKNSNLGILIKQPLKVESNSVTGRITTIAEEMPQLPFSHFRLHFREGTRSPLATPPLCGAHTVESVLTPWSGGPPVTSNATFEIISGPESSPCPSGGTPPFHPSLTAGTTNNAAGASSPFDIRISRTDSEQEITHFSIKLPPGVTGKLAGIPFCPEADIAAARSRERTPHGGQEEIEHPSCPAASEVGHTLVGSGVGSSLTYVPGKVYLAGPYQGSNLSIVAITAAKAGPFDLGTVVIREALKVNPETAEVSVDAGTSDPIPHIIDGIPVHLRDIRVYIDRPEFVRNPTNCEPTSTASTVLGSGTDFASEADDRPVTVTSRFQAASCASLGFEPGLKISLKGPTRRVGLPALTAVVTPRTGDANIGKAVVTLPPSEFLEQAHIGNSCTRVQFNAGGGNGEQCPANSVLGHAAALTPLLDEPLEGPVFLRSNGGERKLPDLVAALHSKDIDIDLVGFIDSVHKKGSDISQIRTTFAKVPDQPVTKFTLNMFGGKKGLLVNSTNLCKGTHKAISQFTGQNGKRFDSEPTVKVQCGKKGKAKKGKSKAGKASARPLALLHTLTW